jgi:dynein heavy chain
VQDRRKYAKIGWNCKYAFNESDINISIDIMRIYLQKTLDNKEDALPWETMRFLIGQAMYGGRVTDSYDRTCLVTYLDEYMGDFLFDKNRPFFFAKTAEYSYKIPDQITKEVLNENIEEMPDLTLPSVFGLHSNAEITYFQNFAD